MKTTATRSDFRPGILCLLAALSLVAPRAQAQLVNDGATNVISGVTTNVPGDLIVGTNGSQTALILTNAAEVDVTGNSIIGANAGSSNNSVSVTGAGSLLATTGNLYVGSNGWGNQLLISAGGIVTDVNGTMGNSSSSSNNLALITGAGAVWSNTSDLHIGNSGIGNRVIVSNGGRLFAAGFGVLGVNSSSRNNEVIVDGAGSVWSNLGTIYVGSAGSTNFLTVTNGGRVRTSAAVEVGRAANSSNNVLIITGSGSIASVVGSFRSGNSGSFNRVTVSGGGRVEDSTGYVGYIGSNNLAEVIGTGSVWTNSGSLTVGDTGSSNLLVVSNGAAVFSMAATVGDLSNAVNNTAVVTGSGSFWSNRFDLLIGSNGYGNRLTIAAGALVVSSNSFIGFDQVSSNNEVVVDGPVSVWSNRAALHVGDGGIGNRLTITNGGVVQVSGNTDIGFQTVSGNNTVLVTGTGSLLTNAGFLYVGNGGSGDLLLITNGGRAVDFAGRIGTTVNSSNNVALVTGAGSLWSNRTDLSIGHAGSGNTLVITSGGTVFVGNNAYVSLDITTASNNLLKVAGGTLQVKNAGGTGTLDIRRGTNRLDSGLIDVDRLVMTNSAGVFEFNGGTLITRGGTISNGLAFVVGRNSGFTNATWDVRGNAAPTVLANGLDVGSSASNATLLVTNGATLSVTGISRLGVNAGASNNLAVIAGPNSFWTNNGNVYVGDHGSFNILLITNGGSVAAMSGLIGFNTGAANNQVVVTGTNSVWTNSGLTIVGDSSGAVNNQLIILNGGTVLDTDGSVGSFSSTANNNSATVNGVGSLWSNSATLTIGEIGSFNALLVTNGGAVVNTFGFIGRNSSANSNRVTVTGSNSLWANNGNLVVGESGSFNALLITNGGRVANAFGFIGYNPGASNNLVTVTGSNSVWANSGQLIIGDDNGAVSNQLIILNGGTVSDTDGLVGSFASGANGNAVTVSGTGSLWSNSNSLKIGDTGSFNALSISNGGWVQAANAYVGFAASSSNNVLRLAKGTLTASSGLSVNANNTLAGTGIINGTVTSSGILSPGSSPGKLTINGSLYLTNNSLANFELGGTNAGVDYDQIAVTNFVRFAGNMSLALLPGYLPNPSDSFTLVSFNSSFGIFSGMNNGSRTSFVTNLLSFQVSYDNNLVLSNVEYADTDGDGQGDLQEQAAGTDAASQASEMRITALARSGGGGPVTVTFQSVPGKNYRIEYSNDLITWSVATVSVPASTASTQWIDDGSLTGGLPGTKRFYRVGLQ